MNLEYGTVTAWNAKTCRIRVELHESSLPSYWLQVPQGYSKSSKRRCPVELGTQVAILLKENGVDGVLLGAVYSEAEPPPMTDDDTDYIDYKDGTKVSYSPSEHHLDLNIAQGTVSITAPAGVIINASAGVTINTASGVAIHASEGTTLNGNLTVNGTIDATGDVTANGISLITHPHSGVKQGNDDSGPPK
ncbi:phage baseplate assembly protein V [Budviciaceae bacterium BWR-B9]|uniref:Phage baseplate assembly protein V n=1 Tax=Limnobaculum allomyrinae TaxID=2791986 RepID=A0ABS1IVZ7_9GAMM|nr:MULTISPECIES: phage baseplate assembly protein V [Limnobaculum]MBK5145931.1 phage baseplate assembly protein V [Limnobaculum allomyrinae]MBV7694014.1 phage baseplate assembly protein V [Limnobaculum sp. M2-1]